MNIPKDFFNVLVKRVLKIVSGKEDSILSGSAAAADFIESFAEKTKRLAEKGDYSLREFLITMELCLKVACVKWDEPEEEKYNQAVKAFLAQVDIITSGQIKELLATPEFLKEKEGIVNPEVETARFRVKQVRERSYPNVCDGEPGNR